MNTKTKIFTALAVCSFIIYIIFLILYATLEEINPIGDIKEVQHIDDVSGITSTIDGNSIIHAYVKKRDMYLHIIIGSFLSTCINAGIAKYI